MFSSKTTFRFHSISFGSLVWIGLFCCTATVFSQSQERNLLSDIVSCTRNVFTDSVLGRHEPEYHTLDSLEKSSGYQAEAVCSLVIRLGNKLSEKQKYDAVIQYILKTGKRLRQTLPPGKETEKTLIELSFLLITSYTYLGMPEQALRIALSALENARQNGLNREAALIYNCLGYIYYMQGQYIRADSAYLKAIEINEYYKDKNKLFLNYNNLSASLGMRNRYNKAIEYAYLAIHQLDNEKDKETVMICLRNVAGIYYVNKEYSLATKILREVKAYQESQNQSKNLIDTYRIMYLVCNAENKKDSALHYLERSLNLSRKLYRLSDEILILRNYASFDFRTGNFAQAYIHLEKALNLKDSADESNNKIKIDNIIRLYSDETEQHAADIKMKDNQLANASRTKQLLFFSILSLLIATLWVWLGMRASGKQSRNNYEKRISEKEKELEKSRSLLANYRKNEQDFDRQSTLKEKELTTLSLNTMRNEEFIVTLRDSLRPLLQHLGSGRSPEREQLYKIMSLLNQQESGGISEEFKYYYENIHPAFYENLTNEFPALTPRDLRLCALLRMGLSTKEIADITFRETRSIESARNRLRKKCNIPQQEDLTRFFARF